QGNPVPNIPVIFRVPVGPIVTTTTTTSTTSTSTTSTTSTTTTTTTSTTLGAQPGDEFMDSQGTPIYTNNNGQAIDIMRTRTDPDAAQGTTPVTAITSTGVTATIDITIN